MTITLNGTTGITTPADTVTTITSPAATALTIQSAGTTAMTIDTSQNVGIGVINPNAYGSNVNVVSSKSFVAGGASTGYGFYPYYVSATNYCAIIGDSSGSMTFTTGTSSPSERMRLDSSGNLLVGTTTLTSGRINTVSANGLYGMVVRDVQNNGAMILFQNNAGTTVGQITSNSTNTAYQTSSDYRLKENIQPMTGALERVSALKPVTYDWKLDGSDGEGFIAHELQSVVPHSVFGEKDAVNEDGSIKPQGVDYSKIVVHLVAAIQELSAKNDALEAVNAAFEARLAALEAK